MAKVTPFVLLTVTWAGSCLCGCVSEESGAGERGGHGFLPGFQVMCVEGADVAYIHLFHAEAAAWTSTSLLLAWREFIMELHHKWREHYQFFVLFYNDITSILIVVYTLILETFSNFMVDLLFP